MQVFSCPDCGGPLQFESLSCICGSAVGFDVDRGAFSPLGTGCANREVIDCNWLAGAPGQLCESCSMTEVVPDAFHDENRALWGYSEASKRWVLANLARWGWFVSSDPGPRPVFHLLSERSGGEYTPVTMGHDDGLVTINVTEADHAERVRRREDLGERLRTMIGHYRHEIGHFFFFARLQPQPGFTGSFRPLFGDERADYGAALERHYGDGPPADWGESHVTPYASSHPHEDWAETFANLLHLTDIVDSFAAAGFGAPDLPGSDYDAYGEHDAERLIHAGVGIGIGLNHVNRSMGLQDIYPFVLTPLTRGKLAFAHRWMRGGPA